ncbi:agamous-like MADS-box protein AGL27 [Salvia divinorum]|uniref:Agamous-like MADS-box protein AGL27 n=1 Tax=Salvia divinorum TaxID=28513 RepID=A0ABD1IC05_SALDI
MGRKKLKLQFIEDRKLRLSTLKRRKGGLEKKLHELTTLCDVPACMIIYDPFTNSTYTWPDDSALVHRLIDSYKANPSAVKACGVSDFFNKNAEEELVKTEFPTWDHRLDLMDESQLRELSAAVGAEAEAVRSRIDFLKREAMMKEEKERNNNDVMIDLEEIVDQDEIFSIADDVMAATNAQLSMPPLDLPRPTVMLDLKEIVDQDGGYSIADVMAAAMSSVNAQLPVPDSYFPPQDYTFSVADVMNAISSNGQLELPNYYCPQALDLLPTFIDHNDFNHGYCSSMDANWFAGDDGGDLASYLWH